MERIERELAASEQSYRVACTVSRSMDAVIALFLLAAMLLVGASLADLYRFTREGASVEYQDFRQLAKVNPDVCAWIRLEGTRIDHPVVQGKDNFEYLDKGFDGRFYAGGTIFLDCRNSRNLTDSYNIIHGHYMEGGAMFGNLGKYLDGNFFREHSTGELLTPRWDYELKVLGVSMVDAYDDRIYYPPYRDGWRSPLKRLNQKVKHRRQTGPVKGQLLALSTCSGAMDQSRIVVYCRMKRKGRH